MKHRIKQNLITVLTFLLISISPSLIAGGIYQQPSAFIKEVFHDAPPKPKVIWPDANLKKTLANILGHKYKGLRIRYWQDNEKTAWVLEEIGKEKPITTGFVIVNGKINLVKVLAFRESRGWEIRHKFFTDQFKQAGLLTDANESKNYLMDKTIDNISGATLSVRAVTKLARIALLLDQTVNKND